MKSLYASTAILVLCLAGCGGGGGSSGGGTTVISAPAPSPSPSSSPSPSPTSTPTPTPVYKKFVDLTGDQDFKTACSSFVINGSPPPITPTTAFGGGLSVTYAASTSSYTLSGDGITRTFGPADAVTPLPAGAAASYARANGTTTERFIIGAPTAGGVALDYGRGLSLTVLKSSLTNYNCVFGVPTLLSDAPATTSVTFSKTSIAGVLYQLPPSAAQNAYTLNDSVVTLSVNLVTGAVNVTVHLIGTLQTPGGPSTTGVDLGTISGTGTIDAVAGSYTGTFSDAGGVLPASSFGGWFFGPQGKEAAFAYSFMRVDSSGAQQTSSGKIFAIQ